MDWTNFTILISLVLVYCSVCVNAAEFIVTPTYDLETHKIMKFKEFTTFSCKVEVKTNPGEDTPKYSIKWKKDGPEGRESDVVFDDRLIKLDNNQLKIYAVKREDLTNYSCEIFDEHKKLKQFKTIHTYGKPNVKMQVLTNPVDAGDTIKLECDVWGTPTVSVHWKKDGNSIPREDSGRYNISDNLPKEIAAYSLTIDNAELTDRGIYSCTGENNYGNSTGEIMVRVKDRFAALWPFIGICAEVFVLCTIIFIYERKRNKSELDESDTDQSPEQKNTPDHGKESVRQRK